jgi:hypothetical protein
MMTAEAENVGDAAAPSLAISDNQNSLRGIRSHMPHPVSRVFKKGERARESKTIDS